MPRKAATVTQADVARVVRAARSAGLHVVRLVVRADGVSLETGPAPASDDQARDEGRVIDL